jgi:catecholate siderophore receptor
LIDPSHSPADGRGGRAGVRAMAKPALSLAAIAGLAGLAPTAALAQSAPLLATAAAEAAPQVEGVEVVHAQSSGHTTSPKFTAPLADTPQTVTVISQAVMQSQNLLGLKDVLSTVPGITFGAGEGGGGFGDSVTLRGYSASSDITIDGVRDSAQYSRSDVFDIEQVEVVNGASSVYSGAGSVGGNINLVSKLPTMKDSAIVSVGGGTDGYARFTVDANQHVNDTTAVRLNLMAHENDALGRKVEDFKRWGVAPSVSFGLGAPTTVTLSWYHQQDNNIPQYGVPFYNGRAVPGVDPANYYGYGNIDQQKSRIDSFTSLINHQFDNSLSLRNLSRYEEVTQHTVVDPPQGAFCLANGQQPAGWTQTSAGTNVSGYIPCATPGFYALSGPRGNLRDTKNTLLYNQTDLTWTGRTGFVEHTLVVGAAFTNETFRLDTGRLFNNPGGALPAPVLPLMSVYNPNTTYAGPINYLESSAQNGQRQNEAAYAFDTMKFGPHFQVTGGVRYEHNQGSNSTDTYSTAPPTTGTVTPGLTFPNTADLLSYRIGGLYKPVPLLSLYVAYGNSKTPSQSSVNGACIAATCDVAPETAINYEAGVKWDAHGGRLSLTGAVFRNDRTNYKVASDDPILPDQVLNGSARVDGVTLGASGKITRDWSVYANYTYLKTSVLKGASNLQASGGPTGTEQDWTKGDPLTQVPDHAFSVWTTYSLSKSFDVGYGVTYQGSMYLTQHAGIAVTPAPTPATYVGRTTIPLVQSQPYWVNRMMATWHATKRLDLQLNVNNLFDAVYYTRIRNNGWATPGDRRQATISANYRF